MSETQSVVPLFLTGLALIAIGSLMLRYRDALGIYSSWEAHFNPLVWWKPSIRAWRREWTIVGGVALAIGFVFFVSTVIITAKRIFG